MANKATTPIAGQLLRVLAMRQRTTGSALPTVAHSLSDFPQMPSWQLVTPTSAEMSLLVIWTLLGRKLPMPRWTVKPAPHQLAQLVSKAIPGIDPKDQALTDLVVLAFFFLL
jgi:hypothetical protein